ncbi:hypothetical protein CAPTEDRAFT_218722 [Capitella teleta]|uniref:Sulfotransferase domain-containing protein n=1 Tax=Capitella teleta TaxID=283909 RepID=X2ANP8_CAPTE|nr:hypothetical protein CAPTEDRAFT_218722 [Capitella teleta]|eukprot:ELT90072.1 hypothetical protein CAPTEDRAFT_218722 [Capitella teleta]
MPPTQTRVFMWAVPRSISTAFFRAMLNRTDTKTLLEPYARAYYFGTDRVSKRYENEPTQDGCNFKDIKRLCEQEEHAEKPVLFVKDMAYYLVNRLDTPDLVPDKFVHTFLLRDPKKSVYSLYKMSLNKDLTGWDHFDANEVGFKELYQMFQLVTEQLGQDAIVLDADDLLKHPETMLRLYCDKVGIEFQDRMLNWDEAPDMQVFHEWMPWFEGVLTSKTFQPSATKPKSPNVMPDLPRHVVKAIDDNMPYYNKMHAVRLRPNLLQPH